MLPSRTCHFQDNIVKALLLQEYKKLAVVDLPEPECGPEDFWSKSRRADLRK